MNLIGIYRVSNFMESKGVPIIPKLLYWLGFLVFNSVVPPTARIGKLSRFAYGGIGVVIHSKAEIGSKVIIGQGVTIGRKLNPEGVPVIGDNVYISAGSRVLGRITVGNNVIIGANSVVLDDVPDNTIVAGAPAKIVRSIDEDIYDMLGNIY